MTSTAWQWFTAAMSISILHAPVSAADCSPDQFVEHVLQQNACENGHSPIPARAAPDVADGLTAQERFIATVLEHRPPSPPPLTSLVDIVPSPADDTGRAEDYFITHVLLARAATR